MRLTFHNSSLLACVYMMRFVVISHWLVYWKYKLRVFLSSLSMFCDWILLNCSPINAVIINLVNHHSILDQRCSISHVPDKTLILSVALIVFFNSLTKFTAYKNHGPYDINSYQKSPLCSLLFVIFSMRYVLVVFIYQRKVKYQLASIAWHFRHSNLLTQMSFYFHIAKCIIEFFRNKP